MKKILIWLTLLCLLLPALPALAETGKAHTIAGRTMDFYFFSPDDVEQRTVWFIDGSDVPYMALSDWPELVEILMAPDDDSDVLHGPASNWIPMCDFSMEGNVGLLKRKDGYTAAFDCDADTITFLDYDAFMRPYGKLLMDTLVYPDPTPDGVVTYFRRDPGSYERYGDEVVIRAGDYGVDFIADGGRCLVPMQTISDLLASVYHFAICYNGEAAFVVMDGDLGTRYEMTPLGEIYYSVTPRARSAAMARFTYGELCLALDTLYGLKDNHNIAAFDTLADNTGLKPDLSGTDPHLADGALYQLLNLHLDDQHTCMLLPSPLNGFGKSESFFEEYGLARSGLNRLTQTKAYGMARMEAYPDGIPTYEEIGNTAYITFDRFTRVPDGVDYYQAPPTEDADDTMGIMICAYSRITRPDSPIENVVLDLSCNMGGIVDAGIFTLAAFLGTSSVSQYNPLSGAMITANHQIDINLDGRFDEGDLGLVDKNLFCLESPVTFSCGSLVACAFKDSNRVALIGRACGGGSCNVVFMSVADGAVYQISGLSRTSFLKNGAFYDIDRGAEPDLPLLKPASFYDRQALTEYINQIR